MNLFVVLLNVIHDDLLVERFLDGVLGLVDMDEHWLDVLVPVSEKLELTLELENEIEEEGLEDLVLFKGIAFLLNEKIQFYR